MVPIAAYCIYRGGLLLLVAAALLLLAAEFEFCGLMARDRFRPTFAFGAGLVLVFLLDAYFPAGELLQPGLALVLLSSLTWQLLHRAGSPVADWALTVASGLYLGVCGACLIRLRALPGDAPGWTLMVVAAPLLADTGAYLIGRTWGRHKMAPALSPGKSWEGYLAGVALGGALTGLLSFGWHAWSGEGTTVSGWHGLTLGLVIAVLAPLGDLAISLVKRQVGAKDSSHLIPGHGGALDRIDSLLWAVVIGYYYVMWVAV